MRSLVTLLFGILPSAALATESWSGWGGNTRNNRWAANNTVVNSTSIQSISQHCRISYPHYGVSATPVNVGNIVYYPTWNGSFVALDYTSCVIQWQINVTDLIVNFAPLNQFQKPALLIDPVSRTSPQIDGDVVFFTTVTHALLIAANATTGKVLSQIQINPHPIASITQAHTLWNGSILVGCSSREESAVTTSGYQCCSFIGNFASLRFDSNEAKFIVNWNVTTLPPNQGWAGSAVWGSQPSIDESRNQVYIGTGQAYRDPSQYETCENKSSTCLPTNIWSDAVVALDIDTGAMKWLARPTSLDVWTVACGASGIFPYQSSLCPNQPGTDANFGMAPAFVPAAVSGLNKDIVVAGQKNGVLYAFAADDGSEVWSVLTSPGSIFAGLSWGVATDNKQAYFTGINSLSANYELQPSGQTVNNSCFGAASLATGKIVWETQVPGNGYAQAPPTVVGDLVLVGRAGSASSPLASAGNLIGLKKQTGEVVLNLALDANFRGGVAVVDNYLMFGTGYAPWIGYTGSGSFNVMRVSV